MKYKEHHLIAVYWTLKRGYWNSGLMADSRMMREDYVKCYAWKWMWFPICSFKGEDDQEWMRMKVEIYKVLKEDMPYIDSLEWHPDRYERIPVTTQSGMEVEIYHQDVHEEIPEWWYTDETKDKKRVITFPRKVLYH
jgi:gamma-glutamylcyclotransferase (GGCT)/AIG2-like uncharacterized protein YtfP